jgi:hypothetical protein
LGRIEAEGCVYNVYCTLGFPKLSSKAVIRNNGVLEVFDIDGDTATGFVDFDGGKTRLRGCLNWTDWMGLRQLTGGGGQSRPTNGRQLINRTG